MGDERPSALHYLVQEAFLFPRMVVYSHHKKRVEALPRRMGLPAASLAIAAISVGCQTFAPGNLPGLTASRQEKKILKQAELDPFPSPADVGLSTPESTP